MLGKNQGKSRKVRSSKAKTSSPACSNAAPLSTEHFDDDVSYSIIPRKVGTEVSLIQFADKMQPYMIKAVLECKDITSVPYRLLD